jgi:Flp pilus assembly pilin Flp
MKPEKIALVMVVISFAFLALAFITGCETIGVSLKTDYGRITYELPESKGTKK